jgi:hypothetical protein
MKTMKKIISLIFISALIFTGCEDETKDVSIVAPVGHPQVILYGPELFSTPATSGTFTDPGAVAYDDISHDSVALTAVSNTVDLSTPGFYSVKYAYSNSNGYVSYTDEKSRLVLVTNADPNQDLSGVYERTSNGQQVNVTKYATGLYSTDNVGGVAGDPNYIFEVYFGVINDSTIQVPTQPNAFGGDLNCSNTSLSLSPDTSFSWVVEGVGFGTSQRTFVKVQ